MCYFCLLPSADEFPFVHSFQCKIVQSFRFMLWFRFSIFNLLILDFLFGLPIEKYYTFILSGIHCGCWHILLVVALLHIFSFSSFSFSSPSSSFFSFITMKSKYRSYSLHKSFPLNQLHPENLLNSQINRQSWNT